METKTGSPERLLEQLGKVRQRMLDQLHKVIVGQDDVIELLLISLMARGHCLLMGVPGLAKTLMVQTLAKILDLRFNRIQFTPDLMPSDITGTEIIEEDRASGQRNFRFVKGPLFANIILADEINRTPPKTQSALLQAMQEYQVTAAGQTYGLELPFFVLATQNPIEQEGTYPLPEAQLDRFMFLVKVDYPERQEEMAIIKRTTSDLPTAVEPVLTGPEVLILQKALRKVPVSDHVIGYAIDLARATRPRQPGAPDFVGEWLSWGAGPRAGQYLILGAKGRALLRGRFNVSCEDVRAVAGPVLRHRIFPNFNADAEGMEPDQIVERLIKTVPEPELK